MFSQPERRLTKIQAPCRRWRRKITKWVDERVALTEGKNSAQDVTTLRRVALFFHNLANSWPSGDHDTKILQLQTRNLLFGISISNFYNTTCPSFVQLPWQPLKTIQINHFQPGGWERNINSHREHAIEDSVTVKIAHSNSPFTHRTDDLGPDKRSLALTNWASLHSSWNWNEGRSSHSRAIISTAKIAAGLAFPAPPSTHGSDPTALPRLNIETTKQKPTNRNWSVGIVIIFCHPTKLCLARRCTKKVTYTWVHR